MAEVMLVDRSEAGKLALIGPGAAEFLDGQVTNEVAALEPGNGVYAALLTPKGKMLGDLRVLCVAEHELLLICERAALQSIFDVLRKALLGWDARLEKRTVEMGLLSLIGARSEAIAAAQPADDEHSSVPVPGGFAVRTDLGIDLVIGADEVLTAQARLLAAGARQAPADEAEIVRVESGRPRFGVDLDDSVIPQEAGLNERAVSFTKGCYVGQETVARLHYKGKPNRHLRGLRLSRPATTGSSLTTGDRQVGTLGSSLVSPTLGPIGLALVRREVQPGDAVSVGEDGTTATVVELPF